MGGTTPGEEIAPVTIEAIDEMAIFGLGGKRPGRPGLPGRPRRPEGLEQLGERPDRPEEAAGTDSKGSVTENILKCNECYTRCPVFV